MDGMKVWQEGRGSRTVCEDTRLVCLADERAEHISSNWFLTKPGQSLHQRTGQPRFLYARLRVLSGIKNFISGRR
jgi:hypothetical protein